MARGVRGGNKTLCGGDVRQLYLSGYIAYRIDVFNIGAAMIVYHNEIAVEFNADFFKANAPRFRFAANAYHAAGAARGLDGPVQLIAYGDGIAAFELGDLRVVYDLHLLLFKNSQAGANYIRICAGQYRGHHFNNGDGLAKSRKQGSKFYADNAAAYYDEAFGQLGHGKDIIGGDYVLTVYPLDGRTRGRRTRCKYQPIVRYSFRLLVRSYDFDMVRVGQSAEALYNLNAMRLFEHSDTGNELFDSRGLICRHLAVIIAHLRSLYAENGGVDGLLIDFRAVQERLGGYAAAIQAGAAEFTRFDQSDLFAKLSRPYRCDVTAGAAAQNNYIIFVFAHGKNLLVCWL